MTVVDVILFLILWSVCVENYWHIICYLFFVPSQWSCPKFQIHNIILYFYFNCSQVKHYVLQLVKCFLDSVYTFIFVGTFLCLWWDVFLLSNFLFIDLWFLSWWEFVSCFLAYVVLDALCFRTFHPSGQFESSVETISFPSTCVSINFPHCLD
jgi:hypothetical protein